MFACCQTSTSQIDLEDFTKMLECPQDPSLCNLPNRLTFSDNPTLEEVADIEAKFPTVYPVSDFVGSPYVNHVYINKADPSHRFVITTRMSPDNLRSCVYLPGKNDYASNRKLFDELFFAGYNVYAISFPDFGFASDTADPNYNLISSIDDLYRYIDLCLEAFHLQGIDLLLAHSTGCLIGVCYAAARKNVRRMILSSPFFDFNDSPAMEGFIDTCSPFLGCLFPLWSPVSESANLTTIAEFNIRNINPRYKNLRENTKLGFLKACQAKLKEVQEGKIDAGCPIDCFRSSTSEGAIGAHDDVLDVSEIELYVRKVTSKDVRVITIPNAIHSVFLILPSLGQYVSLE